MEASEWVIVDADALTWDVISSEHLLHCTAICKPTKYLRSDRSNTGTGYQSAPSAEICIECFLLIVAVVVVVVDR